MSTAVGIAGLRARVMTESVGLGSWLDGLLLYSVLGNARNVASRCGNWLRVAILTASWQLLSRKKVSLRLLIKTLDWILVQLACALIQGAVPIYCIGAVTVTGLGDGTFLRASLSAPRHIVKNHGFFGNLIFQGQRSIAVGPSVHMLRMINTVQLRSERDTDWVGCGSNGSGGSLW